ncbi:MULTISPECIES: DUF4405 domain-containing protein [unclassified Carboxylicivirga]|uniref:DUF4405 domain-containing protein n=1 Tax=Carboxylicivirga TaxID=1628153 RepID=UPI003D35325B
MKKSSINFIIDALLLFCLCAISGIGLLIKYTLPSGQDRWAQAGAGKNLQWLGMDRHQWGDIHFYISLVMIALLVVHIVLHWGFIKTIFSRMVNSSSAKSLISWCFVFICLSLLIIPFFVKPSDITRPVENSKHTSHQHPQAPVTKHAIQADLKQTTVINGKLRLQEVVDTYKVPLPYLQQHLQLPKHVNGEAQLGQLRKQYGFQMSEIRNIINQYHEECQ